jgi:hypothetical protein
MTKHKKKDPTLAAEQLAQERIAERKPDPRTRTDEDIFHVLDTAYKYFPNEPDRGLAHMASTTVEMVRKWRKVRR